MSGVKLLCNHNNYFFKKFHLNLLIKDKTRLIITIFICLHNKSFTGWLILCSKSKY